MSLLIHRCLRRTYLVEELLETWQIEHQQALFASDLEQLIQECLDLSKLLGHTWTVLVRDLFDEQIDDLETPGKSMLAATERALRVLTQLQVLVAEASRRKYTIAGAAELDEAVQSVRELEVQVEKRWPQVNHRLLAESMAAYGRGEYTTAEQMLVAVSHYIRDTN